MSVDKTGPALRDAIDRTQGKPTSDEMLDWFQRRLNIGDPPQTIWYRDNFGVFMVINTLRKIDLRAMICSAMNAEAQSDEGTEGA